MAQSYLSLLTDGDIRNIAYEIIMSAVDDLKGCNEKLKYEEPEVFEAIAFLESSWCAELCEIIGVNYDRVFTAIKIKYHRRVEQWLEEHTKEYEKYKEKCNERN